MLKENPTRYKLGKKNRLHLNKEIDELFKKGSSFISYPLRIVYAIVDNNENVNDKVLVAVAKKYHRRANKRNRIKRLIRENYRLTKQSLIQELKLANNKTIHIALMCVSSKLPNYETIRISMDKAYKKIVEKENTN